MANRLLRLLQFVSVVAFGAAAMASNPAGQPVDYLRQIKPLLKEKCYACHGALKQEAGLRLDTGRLIRNGSANGVVATGGHPTGKLIERIQSQDEAMRMPPEGKPLAPEQVALITRWIEEGAQSPDDEQPQPDPRRHWSFQRPVRTEIPKANDTGSTRNPIDEFIAAEQSRRGLKPLSPATKNILLRRVSLDLIGLPPTTAELHEFLADESPDAYPKVVDRLLSSPQYGERWGRHWMDVWRYADWHGRRYVPDVWNSAPQIWRWRDWIVNSLNSDQGYDQMVKEMLAADEVTAENDEAAPATGYLIRNWYALNPNDWMRNTVEHTGKAFLGLTFNCAHCHDHKYDPMTQDDYFRFRAFFEPMGIRQDQVAGEADPGPFDDYKYGILRKIVRLGAVRIFDKTPDATTWFYTSGDERNRVTERGSIPPGVPNFLGGDRFKVEPVKLPPRAFYPGLRPSIQSTLLAEQQRSLDQVTAEKAAATERLAALPELQQTLATAEADFSRALEESRRTGKTATLVGQQSLHLDATAGRRLVQHGLRQLKTVDQIMIRFQLQILKDANVNFQLAKDFEKGLTAGLVAFESGRIISYEPGTTTEFEVGRYDFAGGQQRFEIALALPVNEDRALLTIRVVGSNSDLVRDVPVARQRWNPIGHAVQGITFDARTGAAALVDQIEIIPLPSSATSAELPPQPIACIDFEAPTYRDSQDILGVDGWFGSTFSQAGATSTVTATQGDETLKAAAQKVYLARRAIDTCLGKLESLHAKQKAILATVESLQARYAADHARYEKASSEVDLPTLSRTASVRSRQAALLLAEADLCVKNQRLAEAEIKPMTDQNRAKEIDVATTQLAAAAVALDKASAELSNPALELSYGTFSPLYPETSTGRRRALAEWIASAENPLTARVAVNHIWLRHFHAPLVASVFDFGVSGKLPSHPELLDWLAVELMQSGWRMKPLHRLIVTSQAYARSSGSAGDDQSAVASDPENKWLWRMNRGRMEAEVVRDSLLAVGGQLDSRLYGQELENAQALTTHRRTIYYCCQPEVDGKSAFGALFDAPESAECYRRTQSIIPQQALALTNSDLIHELSTSLATSLWESLSVGKKDAAAFIETAFEQVLSRVPSPAELSFCQEFLTSADQNAVSPARLREALVRVLLNHNDFVAIR